MRLIDWWVMCGTLAFIIFYGLWRARGSGTTAGYLLAGRSMPWYAMALSIMATQASAITFISTTGQSYVDGMRFVQFYFGLPIAMIIISAVAVPVFHRANVYTAYEYLEQRFDARVRAVVSVVFLIQRGLAVGIALYAPAAVLTVILGWPDQLTTLIMGCVVVVYTVVGGIKAITWTDVQQMTIVLIGMMTALITAFLLMPGHVSPLDAIHLAGAAGRLNPVVWSFNPNDRYNVWSGVIGGMFLFLAYFGCDQSQVQRYLTGKSITQSRLSLLFNAVAKIPMQFLILFIGTVVFVFFVFERPPVLWQQAEMKHIQTLPGFPDVERRYYTAFDARKLAAEKMLSARKQSDTPAYEAGFAAYRQAQTELNAAHSEAAKLTGTKDFNDTNYIFLSYVTKYMPVGIVGLVLAAVFGAAMSTSSAEINSLATVTVIDIYKRYIKRDATDHHYLRASQLFTAFWGIYAVATAQYGKNLGSLIEAVNMVGSLFYGTLLGVFILALKMPSVGARAAFYGVLLGESAILAVHATGKVAFLWYNVIGAVGVVLTGWIISRFEPAPRT
ncbi:MAG: sodium:solute symporter [Bryobacteraceae bacterium]